VLWGKQVYRIKDGQPVPMTGDTIIYGKDPNKPIPMRMAGVTRQRQTPIGSGIRGKRRGPTKKAIPPIRSRNVAR